MKKSDLESGMIIEWNDNFNELGVIIGDSIRYKNGYDELSILDENLRYKRDKKDYISAIYKVKEKCCSLLSIFKKENLELIWESPREINWSKIPKWTKVQVKFPGEIEWENYLFTDYLPNSDFKFCVAGFKDDEFTGYEATRHQVKYCRIHESVEIKEEWYKE